MSLADATAQYVLEKNSRWMKHYGIVGTNRDHFITEISADGKTITAAHTIIRSVVAEQTRAWSDQKTYAVTDLHVANVTNADDLYVDKMIEFSGGKIAKILTIEAEPADPSNTTRRLLRVTTNDVFTGTEAVSRHWFTIVSATQHAYLYLTHEGTGELQTVDLRPLYTGGAPVLANSYYTPHAPSGTDLPTFPSNNTWYFLGAHNLYVDNVAGHLYVCGSTSHSGLLVFDLRTDPLNLVLKTQIVVPVSASRSRSYTHDVVVQWYTNAEQISILGLPPSLANDMLGLAFASDESTYDLINVTALANGVITVNGSAIHVDSRMLHEGGGYYHQAWFTTDKRFVTISDESQPQGRRFDARVPIFKLRWNGTALGMIEQQALKSPWPVNVHNVYTRDNRRARPVWIGTCGLPQRPDEVDPRCTYEPNAYHEAQPFNDYVLATMYSGGTQTFSVRYRAGYDLDSIEEFGNPFEWAHIAEVGATPWYMGRFGGEWSNYAFGNFEFPASEHLVGANGRSSYRVWRFVPHLTGNNGVRSSKLDSLDSDLQLLSSTANKADSSSPSGSYQTGTYSGAVEENPDDDHHDQTDLLPPTFVKSFPYLDRGLNYRTGLAVLIGTDRLHDLAIWRFIVPSVSTAPYAPALAPIGSSIDELFAYSGDRVTTVRDARIQSTYTRVQHMFSLKLTSTDTPKSSGVYSSRMSEIVVPGNVPVRRGDSGSPLVNAAGQLVGILRDASSLTAGYVDIRNFVNSLPTDFPTVNSRFTGFWGTWNARDAGITVDPDNKVYVLAINNRTGRMHSCLSASGSPYHFSTVAAAGDTIQVETGAPKVLVAPIGFVDLKFAILNATVYSTAVANLAPVHLLGTAVGGYRCGGCLLPVLGNVAGLKQYEILSGTFPGGGPKIVYLGYNGTRTVNSTVYQMIYFELIPQGYEAPFGPQYGGLYTATPSTGQPQVHPPNAGNVLTSDETGIALTVAPFYTQTTVSCPEWATTRGFTSRWTQPNQPINLIGWLPIRNPPISDINFLYRPSGGQVNISQYGDISNWRWTGASATPESNMSGILALSIDDDVDKMSYVIDSVASVESQYATANRMRIGGIFAIASEDLSVVYPVDSDTIFGVLARFPVGSTVKVQYYNLLTGAFGWRPRKILQGFAGNQLGLL